MFKWKSGAVLVAAALALAGCSGTGSGTASESGAAGGTLTWGAILPLSSFSAQNASWANESPYLQPVYDTLFQADPDGTPQPNIATQWEYNADRTVLDVTVRDDIKFTDGTSLDADAVTQNLLRFKEGTSPNANNLRNVEDVATIDTTHLEITLGAPDPALLTYLTQNAGLVESPAAFDSPNIETVPVGSGPYIFNADETVVGSSYVYDANPDYWNPDAQHYAKFIVNVYSDPTSLLNAIQGGQVNATTVLDNSSLPQMEAAGFTANSAETTWAGLLLSDVNGTLTPAMADVRVRQAINYAFDRDALLKAVLGEYGTATTQIFGPPSSSFDESLDDVYPYDPAKAKKLLAEAGYANGFTLTMPTAPVIPDSAFTLIASQLEAVGITVEYQAEADANAYISDLLQQKFSAAYFLLPSSLDNWQMSQAQIAAASNWNVFHIDDPKVEELISTIQNGDESAGESAGKELNAYIVDQAWFAPFYRQQTNFMTDANTKATVQVGNAVPYIWNVVPS
ncbi:ABC transporter substrate-binding protein [Naasia lichenicola]|nr:ABC transporter substrate-binding protein [Naasia lichenicola]